MVEFWRRWLIHSSTQYSSQPSTRYCPHRKLTTLQYTRAYQLTKMLCILYFHCWKARQNTPIKLYRPVSKTAQLVLNWLHTLLQFWGKGCRQVPIRPRLLSGLNGAMCSLPLSSHFRCFADYKTHRFLRKRGTCCWQSRPPWRSLFSIPGSTRRKHGQLQSGQIETPSFSPTLSLYPCVCVCVPSTWRVMSSWV